MSPIEAALFRLGSGPRPARLRIPQRSYVPDFLHPLFDAVEKGEPAVEEAIGKVVTDLGFDSFSYITSVCPPGKLSSIVVLHGWTNASVEWIATYGQQRLIEVDPRARRIFATAVPFMWDQLSERGLGAPSDRCLDLALGFGVGSGVGMGFPVHLGMRAYFGLNSREAMIWPERQQAWADAVATHYLLGSIVHALYTSTVTENPDGEVERGQPLTRQEAEVLRWMAQGASRIEVAQQMGLRGRVVERAVRRLCRKLGVDTVDEALQLTAELLS